MTRQLTCLFALLLLAAPALAQPGVIKHEFIYDSAPFPECHASTIVQTKQGTLITAWFGGTYEKHPDVGIWISRFENNAWSKPVEVANGIQNDQLRYPTWNPVLFVMKSGTLALFFKVGPSPDNWWGEMMTSSDDGRSWQHRQKLPNSGIGPVKNKPVLLTDGTLLCPSSDETGGPWTVHVEVTKDEGKTWTKIGPINDGKKVRAIQPTIVQLGGDKLSMLCRDGHADGKVCKHGPAMLARHGVPWKRVRYPILIRESTQLHSPVASICWSITTRFVLVLAPKVASILAWRFPMMPRIGKPC